MREFIDHQNESRQRRKVEAIRNLLVRSDVFGRGISQHMLATFEFGIERHQSTLGQVLIEIGDETDAMR